MTRSEVYAAIDGERTYQDTKWGGHEHEVAAFLTYMDDYLREAKTAASRNAGDVPALDVLRKVVALGVACFEQHGCPSRR